VSPAAAVTAVIAAAGAGERLGAGGPKAFVPLAGRPMIEWSIEAFRACKEVAAIVVAVPPEVAAGWAERSDASGRLPDIRQVGPGDGSATVVAGGATRAESVANALREVKTELVAIHDAARPLVTPGLVQALVVVLESNPDAAGVIPATPITDTIKRTPPSRGSLVAPGAQKEPRDGEPGSRGSLVAQDAKKEPRIVGGTLDRSELWGAQTPQVFRAEALRAALAVDEEARDAATDEAMVIERAGGTVLIHPSGPENLKVTTPLDLKVAELLLAER
jgi:2-C-methyl-D-erythritol 4-phosphate cytidylyltransferase